MIKITQHKLGFFAALALSGGLNAASPLWTYSAPNPAQISIKGGETATVQYTVTNQSAKSKHLVLKPIAGLSVSDCYLATKGSTCLLTVTIDGSTISTEGIHLGPILCDQGNLTQCYQPSAANVLNVTSLSGLNLNPSNFSFSQGGSTQIVTVTNNGPSDAYGVGVINPPGLGVSVSGTCASPLAVNENCQLTFTSGNNTGNTTATISGTNTAPVTESITVTPAQATTLSVSIVGSAILAVNSPNGVEVAIENTGSTTAFNVVYTLPWSGVSTTGSCGDVAPGAGNACHLTFTASLPNVADFISFNADNAPAVLSPPIAFSYQGFLVFAVDTNTHLASVINTADSGAVESWDSSGCNSGGISSPCVPVPGATSNLNGPTNTTAIISTIGAQNAAGLCTGIGSGWYLPAICELGGDTVIQGPCFSLTNSNIYYGLYVYGFGNFTTFYYWSSTQAPASMGGSCNDPGSCAWSNLFSTVNPQQSSSSKSNGARVRCANRLSY